MSEIEWNCDELDEVPLGTRKEERIRAKKWMNAATQSSLGEMHYRQERDKLLKKYEPDNELLDGSEKITLNFNSSEVKENCNICGMQFILTAGVVFFNKTANRVVCPYCALKNDIFLYKLKDDLNLLYTIGCKQSEKEANLIIENILAGINTKL